MSEAGGKVDSEDADALCEEAGRVCYYLHTSEMGGDDTIERLVGHRQHKLSVRDILHRRGTECADKAGHAMIENGVAISTIGHSNVAVGEVIALLVANEIAMVVDVRSVPYSQYTPQFNREMLELILKQAGIAYKFAGDTLGGRPKDPTCYRSDNAPKNRSAYLKQVDYGAVMERPWYQKSIARLVEIARAQRTAILCSEEDPNDCHRHHLIAQTVLQEGISVYHIRHAGTVEEARLIHRQLSLL